MREPPYLDQSLELIHDAIAKCIEIILNRYNDGTDKILFIYFKTGSMVSGVNLPGQNVSLNPKGNELTPQEAADAVLVAFANFLTSFQQVKLTDLEVRIFFGI